MTKTHIVLAVALGITQTSLSAATPSTKAPSAAVINDPAPTPARIIYEHEGVVQEIHIQEGTEAMFQVPPGEQVIQASMGEPDFWPHTDLSLGATAFFSIRPGFGVKALKEKDAAAITLHLVTDHNNMYAFRIIETTEPGDVSIILKSGDASITSRINATPSVVPYAELAQQKQRADEAYKLLAQVREAESQRADQAINSFRRDYPATVRADYSYNKKKAAEYPWNVTGIFHDDHFTYIQHDPKAGELASVYGLTAEGKQEFITPKFDPVHSIYVINKVLKGGYLSTGRKKLTFHD